MALAILFSLIINSLGYFSDTIFASTDGTTGTVDVNLDDSGINLLNDYGQDILNPGDARPVKFTVTNDGNKSVDTKVIITLTSSVPMTNREYRPNYWGVGGGDYNNFAEDGSLHMASMELGETDVIYTNEYELHWAENLVYCPGYGYYVGENYDEFLPVDLSYKINDGWDYIFAERYINSSNTQIIYVLSDIMSGNSKLDEQEIEYKLANISYNIYEGYPIAISVEEYNNLSETDKELYDIVTDSITYDMMLLFDPHSSNAFQNSSVSIQIEVRAKQHRNTEAGWELVAEKVDASIDQSLFTMERNIFGQVELTGIQEGAELPADVVIPEGVQVIPAFFFDNNKTIKTVTLPSTLEEIEVGAFIGCENLETINIPEGLKIVGGNAFSGCNSLTNVELPASVEKIQKGAFSDCENLEKVSFGENVKYFGEAVFYRSPNVMVEVVESNPYYSTNVDGAVLYNKDKTEVIWISDTADRLDLSDSKVTSFKMSNNSYTSELILPATVTKIDVSACTGLEYVYIPEGVTSLGYKSFKYCDNLDEIALPNSLTDIDEQAIYNLQATHTRATIYTDNEYVKNFNWEWFSVNVTFAPYSEYTGL